MNIKHLAIIIVIAVFVSAVVKCSAAEHRLGCLSEPAGKRMGVYYHTLPEFKVTVLKEKTDLRTLAPDIWNQGPEGACTAFGNMAAFYRAYFITFGSFPDLLSMQGLYNDERIKDGTFPRDDGSYISTGAFVLENTGVGRNKTFPYSLSNMVKKAPASYYPEAKNYMAIQSYPIDSGTSAARHTGILTALSNDLFVVFGAPVYDSIEHATKSNPFIEMPVGRSIGGHCMCIVGHDNKLVHKYANGKTEAGFYLVRNSWGKDYGDGGHIWIPMRYLDSLKYADDFRVYPRAKLIKK